MFPVVFVHIPSHLAAVNLPWLSGLQSEHCPQTVENNIDAKFKYKTWLYTHISWKKIIQLYLVISTKKLSPYLLINWMVNPVRSILRWVTCCCFKSLQNVFEGGLSTDPLNSPPASWLSSLTCVKGTVPWKNFFLKSVHNGCIDIWNESGLQKLRWFWWVFFILKLRVREFAGQRLLCSKTPRGKGWRVLNSAGQRTKAQELLEANFLSIFAPRSFGALNLCPAEFWTLCSLPRRVLEPYNLCPAN